MKRTKHMKRDGIIAAGLAAALIVTLANTGESVDSPEDMRRLAEMKAISSEIGSVVRKKDRKALKCLALNIYHEARGEPVDGKLAVAHVVMNRVTDKRFPGSVCGVVAQGGEKRRHKCQFSWRCDGRSDRPRDRAQWAYSVDIARAVYFGRTEDLTNGALWYHADYVRPSWKYVLVKGPKIGRHIFYTGGNSRREDVLVGWMMPTPGRKPSATSL